jgi:class 3 adenylate cyclase
MSIKTVYSYYGRLLARLAVSLCLFCTTPSSSFAQKEGQALVDSLEQAAGSVLDDSNKVKIWNTISYNFFFINPDSGIIYGKKARSLAEKLAWHKGVATADKNIGNSYMNKSAYDTALSCYVKAFELFEKISDHNGMARVLGNMGTIYDELGDYAKALEYQLKALGIYEKTGDKEGKARIYSNIGNLYETPKKYAEALRYYTKALDIHVELNDRRSTAIDMGNVGNMNAFRGNNKAALEYDMKALAIYEALQDSSSIANKLQNIATVYGNMKDFTSSLAYSYRSLKIYDRVGDKDGMGRVLANIGDKYSDIARGIIENNRGQLTGEAMKNLQYAISYTNKAIAIFTEIGELEALSSTLSELFEAYELMGNYKEALEAHKQYLKFKDSVFNNDKIIKFANLEKEHAIEQLRVAERETEAQVKMNELTKTKKRNEAILFSIGIAVLLGGIVLVLKQRKRTEELLLNILPPKIAERLKAKEHPIADHFGDASIIFIDIAGFTKLSEHCDPKTLVNILNDVFTRFDAIAGKYGLEKIKTIGDCYMAVAGIPEKDPDHPLKVADMALEVRDAMKDYKTDDGLPIHFRIGIDCGTVVAGVIGKKKFIYDIWGDSVNTASRMESSGIPGEIHCTDNFRKRLPSRYIFTSRGEVNIKGKGPMHTWILVSSVRPVTG